VCAEWKPHKVPSDLCIDKRGHPSPEDWDEHTQRIDDTATFMAEYDIKKGMQCRFDA
jgi:hypothetical protein